jgi:GNAT superfamily N-acetyltransferase
MSRYRLRPALDRDAPAIVALIARSIRTLGAADYSPAQIEAALTSAFGLDSQLIADRTYFVIETQGGDLAGCGGWSARRTLFGNDQRLERNDERLDPAHDAARIRAFFVAPEHARRGLGRRLLEHCEAEATRAAFTRFELMATLPGQRLYERFGYRAGTPISHTLPGGLTIRFVPMTK